MSPCRKRVEQRRQLFFIQPCMFLNASSSALEQSLPKTPPASVVCADARPRNLMVEADLRTMSAVTMWPLIELNIPVKEILK